MEYKENTVGWHLNTLKEPLRTRAIEIGANSLNEHCLSLIEAIDHVLEMGEYPDEDDPFWGGVQKGIPGMFPIYGHLSLNDMGWEGYDLARECAPDPIPSDDLEGYLLHIGADAVPPLEVEATRYVPGVTGGLIDPKRQHSPRCTTESEKQAEHNLRIAELEAEQEKTKRELMALNMEVAALRDQWAEWIKENTYEYPA